ncbi:MAG TPA: hypothetical protein VF620_16190 [Allosphingosinicella sp.]|jgi:hypothetical protein
MDDEAVVEKSKKERSPNFPFISLKRAIERVEALHASHKKEASRLVAIAPTWGYGLKSSGLLQTVAALKQYGLVEDAGSGDDRKVQVSDLARRIILDTRPGAREDAIKESARRPRLIAEYISKWVPDRPSDAHCVSELELDRGFTADAARGFLRVFDETVAYAKLDEEALNSPEGIANILSADEGGASPDFQPRRGMDIDYFPPAAPPPRGPRPLPERLKVAMDGRSLAVTATLESEGEVDQLIAMLAATKSLLPKAPPTGPTPQATTGGAGTIDFG